MTSRRRAGAARRFDLARAIGLVSTVLGASSLAAGGLSAQAPRLEVDVNAARIRYDTLGALTAPSVSGLAEWQRPTFLGRLAGGLTGFEEAGWSSQLRADLAGWVSPTRSVSSLRLELAGTGAYTRHSDGFDSWLTKADARAHLVGRGLGAWGGVGLAAARSSFDPEALTGWIPTAGAWAELGSVRATLSYLHTLLGGEQYPEADLVVTASRGPLDLTAYAGLRRSTSESSVFDDEWGGVTAAIWLHDHAAVLVSGGRYSSSVLQGLPGGDFFSVGIRLTPRRSRPIPPRVRAPIVFTVERVRSGGLTLRVPDASRVEIAGDWNGWQLEPLEPAGGGEWIVPGSLEPGVYQFNLRVDGERWIVPEGVPQLEGSYGDRVGLLVISNEE